VYRSAYPGYDGLADLVRSRDCEEMLLFASPETSAPLARSMPIRTIMKVSAPGFVIRYEDYLAYKRSDMLFIWPLLILCLCGSIYLGLSVYETSRSMTRMRA